MNINLETKLFGAVNLRGLLFPPLPAPLKKISSVWLLLPTLLFIRVLMYKGQVAASVIPNYPSSDLHPSKNKK